ncbi:MAG: TonB-dependent receptor [Betaproteobacteria bacterium]|nr:TonB-dependent receptor [Betaproteobacteria bacterium]
MERMDPKSIPPFVVSRLAQQAVSNHERTLPAKTCLLLALAVTFSPALAQTQLEEIVVTATHDALTDRRESVTQKTVLDKKEIEALGGLTVGEVIRKLPGIDAGEHTGDGAPSAKTRGMGRDAVQFLVDGERPTANARYALTMVGRMPSGELERIEILRGSSAEHGGSAPVTVNLIMRKARPTASTTLKAAVGLRGVGGDAEPNGQFSFSQGGGSKSDDGTQFSWLLPVTVNHHGMPLDKETTRINSNAGTRNLWQEDHETGPYTLSELILSPRLTWKKAGDSFTLWPSLYRNEGTHETTLVRSAYANPAAGTGLAAAGSRFDKEDSDLTIARLRAEADMKLDGGSKLSGRAAIMGGWRDSDTARTWRDAVGALTRSREKLGRDENELSAAIRLDRPVGEAMSSFAMTSFGLEAASHRREETQTITGSGAFATKTDASQQQWTAWAQHEWSVAKILTLTAGLRGEVIRLESDGRDSNAGQLAPSLAARLDAGGGWIARSSIGAGIKAPKLDEISAITIRNTASATSNTPLEPDRAGNPDLEAERNINLELGLERYLKDEAGDMGVLGASAYWRRTEDFIERTTRLEGARWIERPYNQGTARHYGIEFDTKLKSELAGIKGGALRAHLTLPQGRVDDERLGLTRDARELPRYQFTLGYEQSFPSLSSSAGFQLTKNGKSRTDIPGELADDTKRDTLLDAHWVRKLSSTLNLRLQAQNLLRADTKRSSAATSSLVAGTDDWRLASTEKGQLTWLLSLEGKW